MISPAEARDNVEKHNKDEATERREEIEKKSKELFLTAKSFIETASERGDYETMLCVKYTREDHDMLESAVHETKHLLIRRGYVATVSCNPMIEELLLTVDWR